MPDELFSGCGNEIDVDLCWCGMPTKDHNPMYDGHEAVPVGCVCGYHIGTEGASAEALEYFRNLARFCYGKMTDKIRKSILLNLKLVKDQIDFLQKVRQNQASMIRKIHSQNITMKKAIDKAYKLVANVPPKANSNDDDARTALIDLDVMLGAVVREIWPEH